MTSIPPPRSRGFRVFRIGTALVKLRGMQPYAVVDAAGRCQHRAWTRDDAAAYRANRAVLRIFAAIDHREPSTGAPRWRAEGE